MNYGDVLRRVNSDGSRGNLSRREMIDEILNHFNVSMDDIKKAESAIDAYFSDEPIKYYFLASCVSAGEQIEEIGYTEIDEYMDDVRGSAEDVMPYLTYVIYRLWVEFGYETDAFEDIGMDSITLNQIVSVAQYQLVTYAEKIIFDFGGINKMG
tara:strand:- start:82 stop:543 length:462 start_codon:yes stop_codon:yes gene_type:complete